MNILYYLITKMRKCLINLSFLIEKFIITLKLKDQYVAISVQINALHASN